MTRLEYMKQNGLIGARLGIIQIDWLIKYDAYLDFLEILTGLEGKEFKGPSTARSTAIRMASKKCRCNQSTMARYIYSFEREDYNYNSFANTRKAEVN